MDGQIECIARWNEWVDSIEYIAGLDGLMDGQKRTAGYYTGLQ